MKESFKKKTRDTVPLIAALMRKYISRLNATNYTFMNSFDSAIVIEPVLTENESMNYHFIM
jgi:hypothetical protein